MRWSKERRVPIRYDLEDIKKEIQLL